MKYEETIVLPKDRIDYINNLCETHLTEEDFSKHQLPKFECFERFSVTFDNGYIADVKVCTGDIDDTAWVEMVLFDKNGYEVNCTEVYDNIDNAYELEDNDDNVYIVKVIYE